MDNNIHIFNPDNDLALAYGGENYTAPPMATQLRHDLQILPLWYGGKNVKILGDALQNEDWIKEINSIFELNASIVPFSQLDRLNATFTTWGWSLDMRKRLLDRGVNETQLPTKEYINRLRELSHRAISITIHQKLRESLNFEFPQIPIQLNDFNQIQEFAINHPCCYLKAPWSSSGKGIFRVLDVNAIDFNRWCSGILSRQKSILCEEALNNIMDFAMEYYCENGEAQFAGYSVFNNDSHCSFDSGEVMSTKMLHQKIVNTLGNEQQIEDVKQELERILTSLVAPHYTGYLGIDMMIYHKNNSTLLNPCIEMNLRMTMGMVTSIIGNSFIAPTSLGRFYIEYHKKPINVIEYRNAKLKVNPPKYSSGKLISGIQFLTPPYPEARYSTHIEISQ